jgi:hypothetical protein
VDFVAPQRLTVDTGRDGKLRLELVKEKLLSKTRYFNELGLDVDQEMEDIIREELREAALREEIGAEGA